MYKRAIILAGGKGTRLRPYTVVLPKPLMPVGNYPILEIIIRQLKQYGFNRVTIAVNHQAELIKAFFGNGGKWEMEIDYSLEDKMLSTMGPLKLINDLPENFLIMNGDVLTDLNLNNFFEHHCREKNLFTISSMQRDLPSEYGVLEVGEKGYLSGFKEKPSFQFQVSMGVYMANRKILEYIPDGSAFGFDHLMLELLAKNQPVTVKPHSGFWLDIGREADYRYAVDHVESLMENLLII